MYLKFVVGLTVIGILGVRGQYEEFTKCFEEQFLANTQACIEKFSKNDSLRAASILTFYTQPLKSICSDQGNFIDVLKCTYNSLLKCFKDDDFKSLFPTDEVYEKSFKYLCSRQDKFDSQCLTSSVSEILECVSNDVTTPSTDLNFESWKTYICQYSKFTKKCTESSEKLQDCPDTKETYLELLKIENPSACGGEAGFVSGEFGSASFLYGPTLLIATLLSMLSLI